MNRNDHQEFLNKIQLLDFPKTQYFNEPKNKNQLYLHHTVSSKSLGDIDWWEQTDARVATFMLIAYDGTPYQIFKSNEWAYHLGLSQEDFDILDLSYRNLDQSSIGIEIDSWGSLIEIGCEYYNVYGGKVPKEEVVKYEQGFGKLPYSEFFKEQGVRGDTAYYYHGYSSEQIKTLELAMKYIRDQYDIDIKYNEDVWDINKRALKGENGTFCHCSVREDKTDIHPDPKLIEMWKKLK